MSEPETATRLDPLPAPTAVPVAHVADRSRIAPIATILVFNVGGPLAVYYVLRAAGVSTVLALLTSGALPAVGVSLDAVRRRRPDAIGLLVLTGIVVGSILGLATDNAHLVLLDGIVPGAVFGVACLMSLRSKRPLIYRFAIEAIGPDTPRGRDFADRWRYPAFRRTFRVITAVWGLAFLAEAAVQLSIVETTSPGVAKAVSNLLPPAVAALVIAWNVAYGTRAQRRGERAAKEARGRGEAPPSLPD